MPRPRCGTGAAPAATGVRGGKEALLPCRDRPRGGATASNAGRKDRGEPKLDPPGHSAQQREARAHLPLDDSVLSPPRERTPARGRPTALGSLRVPTLIVATERHLRKAGSKKGVVTQKEPGSSGCLGGEGGKRRATTGRLRPLPTREGTRCGLRPHFGAPALSAPVPLPRGGGPQRRIPRAAPSTTCSSLLKGGGPQRGTARAVFSASSSGQLLQEHGSPPMLEQSLQAARGRARGDAQER